MSKTNLPIILGCSKGESETFLFSFMQKSTGEKIGISFTATAGSLGVVLHRYGIIGFRQHQGKGNVWFDFRIKAG